jgi:hypothetical protein
MAKKAEKQAQTTAAAKDTDSQIIRANINRELVPAAQYVSLYANDTQVQVTPWDIRIMFGLITAVESSEGQSAAITVSQIGEVRMSPQHAKRVAIVLMQQIQNYEKTVGPIPQPE